MLVEIWADVVCPWCYVGKRRFERALATFPHRDQVQVVHRSFQLDPSRPKGGTQPRGEVLRRKYGWNEAQVTAREAQMRDTAAAEGLDFKLGKVDGAATDSSGSMTDGSRVDALNVDGRVSDLASTDLPVDLNAACRQSAVMLRTAGDFTVLGGSTVTNTGLTMVTGNLGVSPGTSVTGFGPGAVTAGAQHAGDGTAAQAQSDLTPHTTTRPGGCCARSLSPATWAG